METVVGTSADFLPCDEMHGSGMSRDTTGRANHGGSVLVVLAESRTSCFSR